MENQTNTLESLLAKIKQTFIVLNVKVAELYNGSLSINEATEIVDSKGGTANYGDPKANFETKVKKSKKVTWSIDQDAQNQDDSDYHLRLFSISAKNSSGTQFFTENPIYVDGDNLISGTVSKGTTGQDFSYTITFAITRLDGSGAKFFDVDPQLKMQ